MIPFAVFIDGVTKEGQAQWVFAVEGDRLLAANDNGKLTWYPFDKCKVVKQGVASAQTPGLAGPQTQVPKR